MLTYLVLSALVLLAAYTFLGDLVRRALYDDRSLAEGTRRVRRALLAGTVLVGTGVLLGVTIERRQTVAGEDRATDPASPGLERRHEGIPRYEPEAKRPDPPATPVDDRTGRPVSGVADAASRSEARRLERIEDQRRRSSVAERQAAERQATRHDERARSLEVQAEAAAASDPDRSYELRQQASDERRQAERELARAGQEALQTGAGSCCDLLGRRLCGLGAPTAIGAACSCFDVPGAGVACP